MEMCVSPANNSCAWMRLDAALRLHLSVGPSLTVEPGVRGRLESPANHLPLLRGGPHRLLHLGAALRQVTPLLPLRPWAEQGRPDAMAGAFVLKRRKGAKCPVL